MNMETNYDYVSFFNDFLNVIIYNRYYYFGLALVLMLVYYLEDYYFTHYFYNNHNNEQEKSNSQKYKDVIKENGKITIIGLVGNKNSGKDTIGDYLKDNYDYVKLSYAEPLKDILQIVFGLSYEQLNDPELKETIDNYWGHTPRELMQNIGTELFRNTLPTLCSNLDNNIWVKCLNRKILQLRKKGYTKFVITDARFLNECEFISLHNGVLWKINRENKSNIQDTHASEDLTNLPFNLTIDNNSSLDELYLEIDNIMYENKYDSSGESDVLDESDDSNNLDDTEKSVISNCFDNDDNNEEQEEDNFSDITDDEYDVIPTITNPLENNLEYLLLSETTDSEQEK